MPRLTRVVSAGLLLTVGMGSLCSCSREFSAKVVGVADGDTITVLRDRTRVRVRIDGIDCPESQGLRITIARLGEIGRDTVGCILHHSRI